MTLSIWYKDPEGEIINKVNIELPFAVFVEQSLGEVRIRKASPEDECKEGYIPSNIWQFLELPLNPWQVQELPEEKSEEEYIFFAPPKDVPPMEHIPE